MSVTPITPYPMISTLADGSLAAVPEGASIQATSLIIPRSQETALPDQNQDVERLKDSLEKTGFLEDGIIRPLDSTLDGIRFVRVAMAGLPREWDLLDAFETLDFGPWRADGEKDINASLRSMGMFRTRWNGNKWDALWHPFPSRAVVLQEFARLLDEGEFDPPGLVRQFPCARLIVRRLEVEGFVLECYLSSHEWKRQLWPALDLHERQQEARKKILEALPARRTAQRLSQLF